MWDVLAAATQVAETAKDTGVPLWSIPASLAGGGGFIWLVRSGFVRGVLKFGKDNGNGDSNGTHTKHAPCATVLRLQTEHDNLVKDVGAMKGDIGMVKGGIDILVQLKTGKPLGQAVAENQPPTIRT